METKIRDILADFIVKIKFEDLPVQVVHQVKRCLLDFMGMALAGSRLGLSPIVAALIFNKGGAEEATIIGDGRKLPVLNAALLNGIQGHVLAMDDGHRFANAHPGVAIMAAALAIAERENATGKQLNEAIVTGADRRGGLV
jgi:2-methylcitrate dehydratase PrpD